jgi:hypothetical protein
MEALPLFESEPQPPARSRRRNATWDALAEIFGYEPLTQSEIRLWGKLSYSLARAGATRESLMYAAREYHKEFSTASLTPTALEKHYSRYAARKKKKIAVCDSCGIGGGHHLDDCNKVEARTEERASSNPAPGGERSR